jgi:hypothetical protein
MKTQGHAMATRFAVLTASCICATWALINAVRNQAVIMTSRRHFV